MRRQRSIFRNRIALTSALAVVAAGLALAPGTGWAASPANVVGNLSGDGIFGCNFAANSTVTEVVRTAPGGAQEWSGTAGTDGGGCFQTNLRMQSTPIDLLPGKYISVTDGTTTKELTLVGLSIETIDPVENTVTGHAPDGTVFVNASVGGPPENGQATASGGSWSYQFTTVDIQSATMINATVNDGDGDGTGFSRQAFSGNLQVSLSADGIGGWGFTANSTVTAVVRQSAGGTVLASRNGIATGNDGNFMINLQPELDLVAGLYVRVTDDTSAYYKDVTLADITIDTINITTDTVFGHAPDGPVNVNANVGSGPPVGGQATASGGTWSYHFSADIGQSTMVTASVPDNDGDGTNVNRALFSGNIQADLTGDNLSGWGFTANSTVSLVLKQSPDGTVLLSRGDVATGSAGDFHAPVSPAIDLVPGMYVKVTDNISSYYKELTLASLSIDTINVATDTVSGHAPDGNVNLNANLGGGPPSGGQTMASGGTWTYHFGVDITQSTMIGASVNDNDGDSTGVNRALFNAHVNANLTGDNLNGWGFAASNTVTVQLRQAPAGTVLFSQSDVPTDGSGSWNVNLAPGVDLQPGMYVKATDNATSYFKELTLANVSIDEINVDTDTVSGTAPDGSVWVNTWGGGGGEATASGGHWSYHFDFDLLSTTNINASVNDVDGDGTSVNRALFSGSINVDLSNSNIGGWGFTPGNSVTVVVRQSPAGTVLLSRGDVPTDGGGGFNLDAIPQVSLLPGMYLKVTDNATSHFKELTLVDLSIDTINVDTDTVSGTAPDGPVGVSADWGDSTGGQATATGGHWSYHFDINILPTTVINANVNDADGDSTGYNRALFGGNINVDLSNSNIGGGGYTPADSVTVVVRQTPGGTVLLSRNDVSTDSQGGGFELGTQPDLSLTPGMYVRVTDNATSYFKDLTLANLSIDTINVDTDTVSGTAPDGPVDVNADAGGGVGGQATATGGHWSYHFDVDITTTTNVGASVNDGDGDSTNVYRALFSAAIDVNLTDGSIGGWGFTQGGSVTVVVKDHPGGTTLATLNSTLDPDGSFNVDPGPNAHVAPGMYVKATDDASSYFKELTVESLSIDEINVDTDTVSGTAPDGPVGVYADIGDGAGGEATATSNHWSFHFDVDITPTTNIGANVNDADGDSTSVNRALFYGTLGVDMTSDNLGGWGFTAGQTVTVVVRQSPTGAELFRQDRTTDEYGGFGIDLQNTLDLAPGLYIKATDSASGYAKTLTLPDFSIDTINATTDTVTGTAPNGPVWIGTDVPDFPGGETGSMGGHWSYHFDIDITPTSTIYANISDSDGDNVGVHRVLEAPVADTTGPTLLAVGLPASVSLHGAPGTAAATVQVTDNASGFTQGWLYFAGPDGWQGTSATFHGTDTHTPDGTYSVDVPLPADAASGAWTLMAVELRDSAGNSSSYTSASFPAQVTTSFSVDNSVTPVVTGSVAGTVTGPSGPLAGASVNVCRSTGWPCAARTTSGDGTYSATALPDGDYLVNVYPPGGSSLNSGQGTGTVSAGGAATVNVALSAPDPIKVEDAVSVNGDSSGVPTVYWQSAINLTADGCTGGTATYTITDQSGALIPNGSGTMTESSATPGRYFYSVPAPYPSHGTMTVDIAISCPSPAQDTSPSFTLYVDPSGFVKDTHGTGIAGATVTLLHSATATGTYAPVPDGSAIMSPANRTNPAQTDAAGHYGWDVSAGYYKVSVAKPGCYAPGSYNGTTNSVTPTVTSASQQIPPAVTNLNLTLDCTNIAPKASFTQSATAVKAGTSVHFDAGASNDANGTVASYTWDFGDGQSGSGQTVNHVYSTVGTFAPTLTVTDNDALPSTPKTGSNIAVGTEPGQVAGLTATSGLHSVSLSWTAPAANNSPITGYTVDVSPSGRHLTPTGTSVTVDGLVGNTTYTFTVAALNAYGGGLAATTSAVAGATANEPTVAITSKPSAYTRSTSGSVAFTVTVDPSVTLTSVTCAVDGATASACTSPKSVSGLAQGSHTVVITATDSDGNAGSSSAQWVVDTSPPTARITAPTSLTSLTKSIVARWAGSDANGIRSYDVRYTRAAWNGRPGAPIRWRTGVTGTSGTLSGGLGFEYCFSVRAYDKAGNVSAWSGARCTAIPLDDRALAASAGWSKLTGKAFFNGTVMQAKRKGATLTRRGVIAGRVALVVTKARGAGSIVVLYNGKPVKTISLAATRTLRKVVIALPKFRARSGTIVIRTLSGKPVQIDGLLLART